MTTHRLAILILGAFIVLAPTRAHAESHRFRRQPRVGVRGTSLVVPVKEMRKRIRIVGLAALVAAVVVPVGFALSLDTRRTSYVQAPAPLADVSATLPLVATTTAAVSSLPDIPDPAKLFAVGAMLCGIAAAMKRTE